MTGVRKAILKGSTAVLSKALHQRTTKIELGRKTELYANMQQRVPLGGNQMVKKELTESTQIQPAVQ